MPSDLRVAVVVSKEIRQAIIQAVFLTPKKPEPRRFGFEFEAEEPSCSLKIESVHVDDNECSVISANISNYKFT